MVVDYEAAWTELQQFVASKTQHGREGLLTKMAELAGEHRVSAGEKSRLLRLYAVEVEQASRDQQSDSADRLSQGLASGDDGDRPAHHDRGGHDVRAGSEVPVC